MVTRKNRLGRCWACVIFQLSRKLICHSELCPHSGGYFFFPPKSRLALTFPQCTLNWTYCHAWSSNRIHYSLPCPRYIITVFACVSAGMVPMQQQQQQQQQGFPIVPVMQPNMQGMMGMNFGGQMPPGAMPMQVNAQIFFFSHLIVFWGRNSSSSSSFRYVVISICGVLKRNAFPLFCKAASLHSPS